METNKQGANTRLLIDVPSTDHFIMHSSELKRVYVNSLRKDFLNFNGQDYFTIPENVRKEVILTGQWEAQAERRYNQEGDYIIYPQEREEDLIEAFIDLNNSGHEGECSSYVWTLESLDPSLVVSIGYFDCTSTRQDISGTVSSFDSPYFICAISAPYISGGEVTYVGACLL